MQELTRLQSSDTDAPEELAHIVLLPKHLREHTTPQAYVMMARVEGFPITALCGFKWIPSKNPEPMPVCGQCKRIYENDPNGFNDRNEPPDA
jgi:hypothetical protein